MTILLSGILIFFVNFSYRDVMKGGPFYCRGYLFCLLIILIKRRYERLPLQIQLKLLNQSQCAVIWITYDNTFEEGNG